MKDQAQFNFSELQELAIVLEVDVRVAERLGVESSERSKRLLEKVNRLLLEMGRELHLVKDDEE